MILKKILILDNYDSFTYNLVHYVEQLTNEQVDVYRNDKIVLEKVKEYDKIILSPGPGIPSEANLLMPLVKEYASTKSILGVCLGHQAIGECFGAALVNLEKVFHGIASEMRILHENALVFKNIPPKFAAGRYHSWIVDKNGLPECFTITAEDENGNIMAMEHKTYDLTGVQFHPESVLTDHGLQMIDNWLKS